MSLASGPIVLNLSLDQEIFTDDNGLRNSHHLKVTDSEGRYRGSWSTGYDEGLVLQHLNLSGDNGPLRNMVAYFRYRCLEDNDHCGDYSDFEDQFGRTKGYESLCGQTLVGWWNNLDGAKQGCFWMRKKADKDANKVHAAMVTSGDSRRATVVGPSAFIDRQAKAERLRGRVNDRVMKQRVMMAGEEDSNGYRRRKGRYQGTPATCDRSCYNDPKKLWYAKDFSYVGGFYGRCSEAQMMRHIIEQVHGPVSVAVNAQTDLLPLAPHNITGFEGEVPYGTEHSSINGRAVRVKARAMSDIGKSFIMKQGSMSLNEMQLATNSSLIKGMKVTASPSKREIALSITLGEDATSWPAVVKDVSKILASVDPVGYEIGDPQYLGAIMC
ncbi:hypothetical protein FOL47_004193 [Perkinsus chesapeaki]|uniref:Uncharacterized protein n=1 Tax=Perkinsus chesapeaki TaxID=330153 RepID=A0A7J6N1K3_PERCH|nr:hypothetical protein FOL47_004193 [Perkinsus chesapeaki]